MDLIVPLLAKVMKIYLAGQVFLVAMFALIISGTLALNRALVGRWSAFPLLGIPLLYNYVFLVGLMNYIFGIGVALWALAGWVAVRERAWPIRMVLSTACAVAAVLLPPFGARHLRHRRALVRDLAVVGAAQRALAAAASSTSSPAACRFWRSPRCSMPARPWIWSAIWWDQRGKLDGLTYVFSDYSDIRRFRHYRGDDRQHRLGGAPPRAAFPSAGLRADGGGRRGLFRVAAHHVRHLHDRPARAARRRLHVARLRRSRIAPAAGAPRLRRHRYPSGRRCG